MAVQWRALGVLVLLGLLLAYGLWQFANMDAAVAVGSTMLLGLLIALWDGAGRVTRACALA